MPEYDLDEPDRQRRLLTGDVLNITGQVIPLWKRILDGRDIRHVLVVGNGDSWAAGQAASIALAEDGVLVRTETPTSVLARTANEFHDVDLAVVVSASGRNNACAAAALRLGQAGLSCVALTGNPGSPLAIAAGNTIAWTLTGMRPCPGIRTYQANLLALMTLTHGTIADPWDGGGLVEMIGQSYAANRDLVEDLAAVLLPGQEQEPLVPVITALGAHVASARYVSAKVVETAGLLARADDLEEWWHVARFAEPMRSPLIVLDIPARAVEHGSELVNRVRATGRTVVATTSAAVLGLAEPWWPLWHLRFGVDLGIALARRRGVRPFSTC